MLASGKVFKYGDNIDTDVIIPARYLNTPDMKELASHCMEDIDKEFAQKVEEGDIIVANKNFGCGSSREHAPIAIKESGIKREEIIVTSKLWNTDRGYENAKKYFMENPAIMDEVEAKVREFYMPKEDEETEDGTSTEE